ncbi:hypothetical protein ETB97_003527 [Aspergillus alliaceus]|uniref:Uncharacterized protein n=1 Tax=Petromyces alliaceus TaxID=209559 RepID=A0A8H6A113_PETAA|nr:hypothetical protein ETB97_003527 [Aspergillus burnettii]
MARQLRLNTSVGGNQRYSFLETPLEMHAPGLRSNQQQQSTPPPPQPLAVSNPDTIQGQAAAEPVQPQSLPPLNEKALYMQQEAAAPGYPGGPNIEDHPANHAPFADAVPQQHDAVVPDYSYAVPPPHSPGPLPTKTYPETPSQVARSHTVAIVPDTNPLQSPQLPYFPGPPTASGRSCTPLADDVAAYHRPGQISHPNQHVKGGTWSHGLWLMATVQHRRTRKAYGIPGDIVSDCVRATCCTCCTLIQDENEIRKREEERASTARTTGAALVSPYFAPPQMSYGPSLR